MKYFSLHAQSQSNTNVFLTLTLSHRNMTTVSLVASACPHLKAFPPFLTPLSSFSLLPSFPPPRNGRWMEKTCSGGMWGKTTMIPSVIPETKLSPNRKKQPSEGFYLLKFISSPSKHKNLQATVRLFFEGVAFGRFMELFPFIQVCCKNSKLRYISC